MIQKDRIINGCEELFQKAGIKAVTMDEIAKHLGISKKTIYQHYSDKGKIVFDLIRQKIKANEKQINSKLTQYRNAMDKLISLEIPIKGIFESINPIVFHELEKYYPEAWSLIRQFKSEFLPRTLENLLNEGIADGLFRPEIDPRIIARMCVIDIGMSFNQSVFPATEFDLWKIQSQCFEHFTFGLGTEKGIALFTNKRRI